MIKARLAYLGATFLVIALGLLSRSDYAEFLPDVVANYAGDTLWAVMVYLGFRFLLPTNPVLHSAIAALVFSFAIEFSQFYQADWINQIRSTTLGALVLGFGFKLSDLVCYSLGICITVLSDCFITKKYKLRSQAIGR